MAVFHSRAESSTQAMGHMGIRMAIKRTANIAPLESELVRGYLAVHDDPESLAYMVILWEGYHARVWGLCSLWLATADLLLVVSDGLADRIFAPAPCDRLDLPVWNPESGSQTRP